MVKSPTTDERLDKIDQQLERIAKAVVNGFSDSDKKMSVVSNELRGQIDIYARAVDAYAKHSRDLHARNVSTWS